MWRSKERKGFGIRQISVQILAHYPWSLFSLTGSSWRHQAFMEILLKLIIPNISCYIGSYHGELFRPVLVRTVPAAETKNPQLLMAYYKTGLFSPWDIVWLDVFSGLSWKGIQTFSTLESSLGSSAGWREREGILWTCLEVAHVISSHISLVKPSHITTT